MNAPDSRNEAVQFLYKHGELTYSAAAAAIAKLCNNGFHITRAPLAEALAELIAAYEDIMDYGIVFAKKDQQDRLNAAKEKFAAIRAIGERADG